MRTSDLLVRLAALVLIGSSLWNMGVSLLWIVAYIAFFGLGLLWVIPLLLGGLNLVLAFVHLVGGYSRVSVAGPLVGLFVGLCNFNFLPMFLDLVALGLTISGYLARDTEGDGHRR